MQMYVLQLCFSCSSICVTLQKKSPKTAIKTTAKQPSAANRGGGQASYLV